MREFRGNLGNYKVIQTDDLTLSIWSEYFDEVCHNLSGAYQETLFNYIEGCEIKKMLKENNELNVLDVGFGVGLGLLALIDEVSKNQYENNIKLTYYSIELDETLLLWSLKNTFPDLLFSKNENQGLVFYQGNFNNNIQFYIFLGDGTITLPKAFDLNLLKPIDAIFQDAFSPRKNPELWTAKWFSFLKNISKQTVRLSTYSASASIKKSLLAAGWRILNAPGFALKKSMTKAFL